VSVREEDLLKNYPLTYKTLTETLQRRYDDFLQNNTYHDLRRKLEKEPKYSLERVLDPNNPKSSRQRFFNSNILQEFDKHYNRRTKPTASPKAPIGAKAGKDAAS
jgi:hypothetical protein